MKVKTNMKIFSMLHFQSRKFFKTWKCILCYQKRHGVFPQIFFEKPGKNYIDFYDETSVGIDIIKLEILPRILTYWKKIGKTNFFWKLSKLIL